MLRRIPYFFSQTVKGMRRNLLMTLISMGIIAAVLFVFGILALGAMNIHHMAGAAEERLELAVFLEDDLTEQELWQIKEGLIEWDLTHDVRYVSSAMALERLRESWTGRQDLLEIAGENPLPHSFEARLRDPRRIDEVAREVGAWPGVIDVGYGRGIMNHLLALTRTVRWVGLALILLMGSIAVFITANTIRLTVHARRREIEIMKFVGATDTFIHWPFFLEGMVMGFLGGLLSSLALVGLYSYGARALQRSMPYVPLVLDGRTLFNFFSGLLLIGVVLGGLGSLTAVRNYVDV